ncbi:BTB/POZ domain-containing protein KCTD21 [Amazona aestiva]|uniref:BTB/POZ domain-containing protein KCTD21 n=3 Tax=Amazona TaxID=12929 RepID=A0A0Q3Q615_AMAAE|nr:BTB/POZ domain-containing protein KCTD21 [Amazona aestiva]
MSAKLCATAPTALPTPEPKLGLMSDAVAGSIDVVLSFKQFMLLPCFVGSLPFETAGKEGSYKNQSQHRDFSIMSEPITLNVGGKLYTTSLSTLTSFPDSMLGAMFSGKIPTKKDSQGNCFIDRDGKIFRYILNFLRTSHLDLPEDFQEMGLLRREVDFYQIQPLIEVLQEKEVELSKAEKNAMLNISLDQKTQTVHFTVREAPQIYSLSSSNMEVFSAHIFSTSCLFLKLLGSKLYYCFNGNLSSISSYLQDPNHLTLDWVASVEGLPEEEYTRQNLKRLWVVPDNKQINSFQVFVEEVLKIAMSDGFCIDSSHPHTSDFMNNKIIRLIRYK